MTTIYEEVYEIFNSPIEIKLSDIQIIRSLYDLSAFRLCHLNNAYRDFTFKSLPAIPDYEVIHTLIGSNSSIINPLYELAHELDLNLLRWIEREHIDKINVELIVKYVETKIDSLRLWLEMNGDNEDIPEWLISLFKINQNLQKSESPISIYVKTVKKPPSQYILDTVLPLCDSVIMDHLLNDWMKSIHDDPIKYIDPKYMVDLSATCISRAIIEWICANTEEPPEWMLERCNLAENLYSSPYTVLYAYIVILRKLPPENILSKVARYEIQNQHWSRTSYETLHKIFISDNVPELMKHEEYSE